MARRWAGPNPTGTDTVALPNRKPSARPTRPPGAACASAAAFSAASSRAATSEGATGGARPGHRSSSASPWGPAASAYGRCAASAATSGEARGRPMRRFAPNTVVKGRRGRAAEAGAPTSGASRPPGAGGYDTTEGRVGRPPT